MAGLRHRMRQNDRIAFVLIEIFQLIITDNIVALYFKTKKI